MFAVETYAAVRRFVFVEGKSRREAARVFGLGKMCRYSALPGYVRSKAPERPKLGPAGSGDRFRDSDGFEIGDICNFIYGTNGWDAGLANQQWGGHFYEVQQEFDNHTNSLALTRFNTAATVVEAHIAPTTALSARLLPFRNLTVCAPWLWRFSGRPDCTGFQGG